jgi:hypothetical protein
MELVAGTSLARVPEKWEAAFGTDHAQNKAPQVRVLIKFAIGDTDLNQRSSLCELKSQIWQGEASHAQL